MVFISAWQHKCDIPVVYHVFLSQTNAWNVHLTQPLTQAQHYKVMEQKVAGMYRKRQCTSLKENQCMFFQRDVKKKRMILSGIMLQVKTHLGEKGFLTAQVQSTQGRMTFADTVRTEKPPEARCTCMNVISDFGQSVNIILKELLVDAFINKREATDLSNTS